MFRVQTDRKMCNSGTDKKPFLSADIFSREYFCGPIRYCSIVVKKTMENIRDDRMPYFVKVTESVTTKVFGLRIIYRERFWKYDKLDGE